MPVKENEQINTKIPSTVEQQPVRELTQTDKLNKKLLQSFLERINKNESTDEHPPCVVHNSNDFEQ